MPCPGSLMPREETWYPLYRTLSGPQSQSQKLWKISPTLGFDSQAVQPLVSCCIDYTIPAHKRNSTIPSFCSPSYDRFKASSKASSPQSQSHTSPFSFQGPLISLQSFSSPLCLLSCLPITSIPSSIFPSVSANYICIYSV